MQVPETEFAHCGDTQIAYQVFGTGEVELVMCGGPAGHIEAYWEEPLAHRWFEQLAGFARVVHFDRRGTGASDPSVGPLSDELYMEDLEAVIDACGFDRPVLLGAVEAARMCAVFAAHKPDRVRSLVLLDCAARGRDVLSEPRVQALSELIEHRWGKGEALSLYAPSMADDERFRRWGARLERLAVTPRGARDIVDLSLRSDIGGVLPQIRCPTLVVHHADNQLVPVELGRSVAEAIPDARFVTIGGTDSMAWLGDTDSMLGEIEEFLTGTRSRRQSRSCVATILFTDIAQSTRLAARLGDRQWREVMAEHDRIVEREILLASGTVVKAMGDGFLAVFETPQDAVRAAEAAIAAGRTLDLSLRAGVHVGTIERQPDDVRGMAVHIASRITHIAAPGQTLVSSTVKDILIDAGIPLSATTTKSLRGVPGQWTLYAVASGEVSAAAEEVRPTGRGLFKRTRHKGVSRWACARSPSGLRCAWARRTAGSGEA